MDRCRSDVLRRFVAPGDRFQPCVEEMCRFITPKDSLLHRSNCDVVLRASSHHDHLVFYDCILPLERATRYHSELQWQLNSCHDSLPGSQTGELRRTPLQVHSRVCAALLNHKQRKMLFGKDVAEVSALKTVLVCTACEEMPPKLARSGKNESGSSK